MLHVGASVTAYHISVGDAQHWDSQIKTPVTFSSGNKYKKSADRMQLNLNLHRLCAGFQSKTINIAPLTFVTELRRSILIEHIRRRDTQSTDQDCPASKHRCQNAGIVLHVAYPTQLAHHQCMGHYLNYSYRLNTYTAKPEVLPTINRGVSKTSLKP